MMITAYIFAGLSFFSTLFPPTLTINVKKLPSSKGKLLVGIYSKKEGFRDESKTYRNITIKANEGNMTVVVADLPPGKYAIAIYHDANENGKLDKNFLGIPTEKYGFSNDAMGSFGPPDYEDCLVNITENKSITINLK
jgi:uncharacterized protein (DUF2141 family)